MISWEEVKEVSTPRVCLHEKPFKARRVPTSVELWRVLFRSLLLFLGLSCRDPCSKGGFGGIALLDTCMTAQSLLENDERLEDAIKFLVHNLEGSLHLVKWEGMGRHERWIDALHLQHAQEAFHAQTATRTQAGRNGLFRHADTPLDARNVGFP